MWNFISYWQKIVSLVITFLQVQKCKIFQDTYKKKRDARKTISELVNQILKRNRLRNLKICEAMPEGGNNCKQDYGTHGTLKTLSHCKHEIYL